MSVTDFKLHDHALARKIHLSASLGDIPISQASVVMARCIPFPVGLAKKPGQPTCYEFESAQYFVSAFVNTANVVLQNLAVTGPGGGGVDNASTQVGTAGAGTYFGVAGTLSSPQRRAALFFPGDTLLFIVTTNGTGTMSDLTITVTLKPSKFTAPTLLAGT